MRLSYTKRKDCKSFWTWASWNWYVIENKKFRWGWRRFGLTWDSDNHRG